LLDDPDQERELAAFPRTARPGMVLFDLGAHYGVFSLAALHFGGADARAVAVDPSPAAIRLIERQARLCGVTGRLTALRAAAAAQPGEIALVAAGVIAAGYYVPPTLHHPPSEQTRVPAVTVDGLAERLALEPTHLKIDVEGAEAAVLRGAHRTLQSTRPPLVFLELHGDLIRFRGGDAREPLDHLRSSGYELTDCQGTRRAAPELANLPLVRLIARHRDAPPVFDGSGGGQQVRDR
jgi:FkbM family methyltransferase